MTEKPNTLWHGMRIPIIGLTGERWSGKTLFASAIDPTHSLMIDLESSSETYNIPFKKRYNLYDEVIRHTDGKPPTAIDCYLWFRKLVADIKPGEYSVVICDPISDVEAGLTLYVQQNPEQFGHTKGQYERASGIMWGDLQAMWKLDLGVLASKVETFAFTAHLGSVWGSDGRPQPGKTKPKGKSVLMELASLYLQFERKPDQQGKIPKKPIARVLKSRLAITEFADGEMKFFEVLPGTVPDCDPNKIRDYIKNPVGKREITDAERAAPEVNLSEDEKLLLKSQVVGEMLQIEQSKSSRLELMKQAAMRTAGVTATVQSQPMQPANVQSSQFLQSQAVAGTQPQQHQLSGTATAVNLTPPTEAPKRTRRTKEQMAADAAREAAEKARLAESVAKVEKELAEESATSIEAATNPVVDPATVGDLSDSTPPFGTAEKPFNPSGEPRTIHQTIMAQFAMLKQHDPAKWTDANFNQSLKNKYQVDSVMQLGPEPAERLRKALWNVLTTAGLNGDGGDLSVKN